MIEKQIVKQRKRIIYRSFSGISDFVNFVGKSEVNSCFVKRHSRDDKRKEFYGTSTFKEAMEYFVHGWEEGTEQIKKEMKQIVNYKQKKVQCYSIQGHAPCVPRYIIGVPDNMITSKTIYEKNKVIKIYKNIGYSYDVENKIIINESVKTLDIVKKMEASGIRTELYILFYETNRTKTMHSMYSICIKKADQRLNLKQVSFPMIHPAMHRRINFDYIEKMPEFNTHEMSKNYGYPYYGTEYYKELLRKGSYYFPAFIEEDTITDIEKYRI